MQAQKKFPKNIIKCIEGGGVVVIPTDTLYGIVGSALNKNTVERIYRLRKRNKKKPMIVLIGKISGVETFNISLPVSTRRMLRIHWGGLRPTSIILPVPQKKWEYLHRGTKTIAFRIPRDRALLQLLQKTGPLVVPSANPEGLKPAGTVKEAQKYFGKKVDFYIDGGKRKGKPSRVMRLEKKSIVLIRK